MEYMTKLKNENSLPSFETGGGINIEIPNGEILENLDIKISKKEQKMVVSIGEKSANNTASNDHSGLPNKRVQNTSKSKPSPAKKPKKSK